MNISATMFLLLTLLLPLRVMADLGALDPAAKPQTHLGPGFLLALNVSIHAVDEKELCGQFPLDKEGNLSLKVGGTPIDLISLRGLTAAEAERRILSAVGKYFVSQPEVKVGIARIPRFQVLVEGATFRIGPLTLTEGARLSDVFAVTGYQPGADLTQVTVTRIDKGGSRITLIADFGKVLAGESANLNADPELQNGDKISVPLTRIPMKPKTIRIWGEVKRQAEYPYKPGMRVRDALTEAFGLLPSADPERVVINRPGEHGPILVNASQALKDVATDNLELRPDDTIFVGTRDSGQRYAVLGSVASPTTFDFKKPVTLSQAISDAGGFKPDADRRNVVVIRNMMRDPSHAQPLTINFDRIATGQQKDIQLQPGDVVQIPVRRKPSSPLLDIGMFLFRMLIF